jgi:succinate-acetate transporter protein
MLGIAICLVGGVAVFMGIRLAITGFRQKVVVRVVGGIIGALIGVMCIYAYMPGSHARLG